MDMQIVAVYFFADEILKANRFFDDPKVKMTTAEMITAALTAALFFGGNQSKASSFLKTHAYIPHFLSKGHFNYRLHQIPLYIWQILFSTLANFFKQNNSINEYVVDSFPVPVCDNIRIFKSKIFSEKKYRGYIANKKRYFYGLRVHLIATTQQEPVEFIFSNGSESDISAFKNMDLDIPEGSTIYADKAYNCYEYEDYLKENGVHLIVHRRINSKRPLLGCIKYLQNYWRKSIETIFSRITALFPKFIHAVTSKGFELKVFLFILAYSLKLLI